MFCRFLAGLALLSALFSCGRGRTETSGEEADSASVALADTLEADTLELFGDEEQTELPRMATEGFGDFFFAFTHSGRFQAERIRFPLPVTDLDGTERTIRSGRQFRSEFQLPDNEYYTLLLGERGQLDVYQTDTTITRVSVQCIRLATQTMADYQFDRTDGQWFLTRRTDSPLEAELGDFFRFYERFTTDSLFQQESLARQLTFRMEDSEENEEEISGTIDRDQWPVFRPEMPAGEFVNIDFGQTFPNPNRIYLMQCGISNSMMDTFTFHREGDRWLLTSYEN